MGINGFDSIFGTPGGLAGMLGDYNSIRSGSYKKLLKSYYDQSVGKTSARSGSTETSNVLDRILEERKHPSISAEASAANSTLMSSVTSMKTSLKTLQGEKTYEDTTGGSTAGDKVKTALKNYVSAYNDAVESSKKSTMAKVSSNLAGVMKATKEKEKALQEIGITIGHDGTLSFNEKKYQTANVAKVKELFSSDDTLSYGSKTASLLDRKGDVTTGYSSDGTYAPTAGDLGSKMYDSSE